MTAALPWRNPSQTNFIMNTEPIVPSLEEPLSPTPLRRALLSFALAVHDLQALASLPSPESNTRYHAREYLDVMEDLLVDQLVTAVPSQREREALLLSARVEGLSGRALLREKELLDGDE